MNYCVVVYGVLCVVVFVCLFSVFVWFVSELLCAVVWFVVCERVCVMCL